MPKDAQGLEMTAASDAAAEAFDHAIEGFLRYRFDTGARVKAALALDPQAPMAQAMAGYSAMLAYDRAMLPRAEAALARAEARMRANARISTPCAPGAAASRTARCASGSRSSRSIRATSSPSACTTSPPSGWARRGACSAWWSA